MKKIIGILLLTLFFAIPLQADQLAYISKKEAKVAAKFIKKLDYVYLFCGCCDNGDKIRAEVVKAKIHFTDYENYYEVMLTYRTKNGEEKTKGIDLAYVWTNKNGDPQTIGEVLGMEHDPCKPLAKVKWPK